MARSNLRPATMTVSKCSGGIAPIDERDRIGYADKCCRRDVADAAMGPLTSETHRRAARREYGREEECEAG